MSSPICSVGPCTRTCFGKKPWCRSHYERVLRHGADADLDTAIRAYVQGPPEHGTQNRYNNWGCRCDACRAAHSDDMQRTHKVFDCAGGCGRKVWRGKAHMMCRACYGRTRRIDHPHGTSARYGKGCRCRPCRDASARERRERRARTGK